MRRSASAAALAVALAGHAGMAQAQAVGGAAPPVYSTIDGNGVDHGVGVAAGRDPNPSVLSIKYFR